MNIKMRIKIVAALCFLAMLCLLNGCSSVRVSPWWFSHEISSADRVVVTNVLADAFSAPGMPRDPDMDFRLTITGPEVQEIIQAVSGMHTEVDLTGQAMSATLYEWHLQFYRDKKFLGDVGLSPGLIECGDYEYPAPPALKKLYARIEEESRKVPYRPPR
jgi:hypothetical protein